jgi:hypothetical protein
MSAQHTKATEEIPRCKVSPRFVNWWSRVRCGRGRETHEIRFTHETSQVDWLCCLRQLLSQIM